jgi:NAD(P)-dependent dehydrogenase (short-subunit alcohol dehydrogenase family)
LSRANARAKPIDGFPPVFTGVNPSYDHWLLVTDMRFKDRVALITAAASGIGRATAEIMAREGGVVVAVDKDEQRLDDMVASLRATQGRVHGRKIDALDPREVDALVPEVAAEFGAIDILVNAVGGSTIIAKSNAPVEELSFADWQNLIAFNLEGTFLLCHAVTPVMKRQRRGKIVNLASIAGRGLSSSSSSAYAAAKGGIIAFTRKLSFELGPFGINVNAIAPSLTLTERIRPRWEQRSAEEQAAEIARTPLRRVAEAADQARVIAFLASADADFVTGVTIDVTGGL